jgi:MoxR-like ATPase
MSDNQTRLATLTQNVEKVIIGKTQVIELAVITLLCRGHLLLEDVPGLGKTMLARTICASLALEFKRIQFTPDLLPSDVTGVSIYNQKTGEFEFKKGPLFTNILLADEINRTTPRTQSSLLESMEERQVTADGTTYALPKIFMVIATQNPVELQGTYPLPEAQLDRFFMRIRVGYPTVDQEIMIMGMQAREHPIHSVSSVISEQDLTAMQASVKDIHMDASISRYIAEIVAQTRKHPDVLLGASPRGSLALMRASQALALVRGSDFVDPSMVKSIAAPVLAHRLVIKPQSRLQGVTQEKAVEDVLNASTAPVSA